MEKLHFSININAPAQKVWDTMLNNDTYIEWTAAFNPTPNSSSTYEGDWSEGSTMKFLGTGEDGAMYGMYARIAANRVPEFLSIQHLGEIIKGEEKPFPTDIAAFENYTLTEIDGSTKLDIDLDTNEEFKAMFEGMWPKALEKLKELCEK